MKIAYILNDPLIISAEKYHALKEEIEKCLLAFFDQVSCKDADSSDAYISFYGTKNNPKWAAVAVFHCAESYEQQKSGTLQEELKKRLSVLMHSYNHAISVKNKV